MPTAKTHQKKTVRKAPAEIDTTETEIYASSTPNLSTSSMSTQFKKNKYIYIVAAIIVVVLIISFKKGLLVAATVNGAPITTFEVLQREDSQFRKQTLDSLVEEKLILGEANKKGAKVTEAEINTKIADIEKQVGGASALDSLLTQQGQTRKGIRGQIKISLLLEKMYSPEASVSAEEITKFIEQNKEQMQSSDPAALTKEASDYLKSQKLNQIFSTKFAEIKKAASINIF